MQSSAPSSAAVSTRDRARRGLTLIEVVVATTLMGLVIAMASAQLLEGVSLSLHASRNLEHARSARVLVDRLTADMRRSQIVVVYPSFNDRTSALSAGQYGNYLVLHQLDVDGKIIRTVGYYLEPGSEAGTWVLYRHDSDQGAAQPGQLPLGGTHPVVSSYVRLPTEAPANNHLFRCLTDRGVILRGEIGGIRGSRQNRTEFFQCALSTRS